MTPPDPTLDIRARYEALIQEAMPFARLEVAFLKQQGDNLSDEGAWVRNIAAAYASFALMRGQSIEQVALRHLQPVTKDIAA